MAAHILTQKILKEYLNYNPDTGIFARVKAKQKRLIGKVAGHKNPKGYWMISVCSKDYRAHRLAWLYVYGHFPNEIDHINGIRDDNRLVNLRNVNHSQNLQNLRKARADNRTGLIGSSFHARDKKYHSSISVGGNRTHLGCFDTAQEAHDAYIKAKRTIHECCTI